MKNLNEHNRDIISKLIEEERYPHGAGVACPRCGEELMLRDGVIYTFGSFKQKKVTCYNCDFWDYMII